MVFAFLINLYITGIFAFAGFALPTQKLMPSNYYKIQNPKRLKNWYQKLGVENFRKFLLATFWKNEERHKRFFDGTAKGIEVFSIQTKKAEFGHLIPFVLISVLCIFLIKTQMWYLIGVTMIINIFFNFYPIILQRHHRTRIARLGKLLARKKSSSEI